MTIKLKDEIKNKLDSFYKNKSFGTIVLPTHNEVAKWKHLYESDIEELKHWLDDLFKSTKLE